MEEKEKYLGYGKFLDLPSGRVGIELTLNQVKDLYEEIQRQGAIDKDKIKIKILVLPVKPHNVTNWRTHSVKLGESKYKQSLINEH